MTYFPYFPMIWILDEISIIFLGAEIHPFKSMDFPTGHHKAPRGTWRRCINRCDEGVMTMTPGRSVTQLGILPTKRRNPWENHGKTMRIHEQKCEGKISEVGIAIKIDDIQEKRRFYHQNWRCSQQFSGHPSHPSHPSPACVHEPRVSIT